MVTWKGGVTLANCVADAGLEWTGKKGHLPRTDVRTRTDHEVNNRRIDAYTLSAGSVGTLGVSSCLVRPTSGAGRCILIFVRYNKRDATCVHYDAHEMETYMPRERLITKAKLPPYLPFFPPTELRLETRRNDVVVSFCTREIARRRM